MEDTLPVEMSNEVNDPDVIEAVKIITEMQEYVNSVLETPNNWRNQSVHPWVAYKILKQLTFSKMQVVEENGEVYWKVQNTSKWLQDSLSRSIVNSWDAPIKYDTDEEFVTHLCNYLDYCVSVVNSDLRLLNPDKVDRDSDNNNDDNNNNSGESQEAKRQRLF